jgi:diguanylate cyclase (GGDEF)-like protein
MKMTKQNLAVVSIAALAAVHFVVCAVFHSALHSSLIQLTSALLATVLCLLRAKGSHRSYLQLLWNGLGIAFFLWACGETYDLWWVITQSAPLSYPNLADYFWMLYSFPILLLASRTTDISREDWTGILDMVQACISVGLLVTIILLIPGLDALERAYDIQGVAMLFACAIRYSTSERDEDRTFFRNLTLYVVSYCVLGLVTQLVPSSLVGDGKMTDLAFSYPFLIFCAITIRLPEKLPLLEKWKLPRMILPAYIHGISSLGLALTSVASSVLITAHHARFGVPGLFLSCGVFALRTAFRESQLKRAQMQLEYDNHHDHLTGLANRALLTRELERPGSKHTGNRSLLFLDLDRFKTINDNLGHVFGDRLLIHVADTLRSVVRPGDIVARFGGDEFVILLNNCQDGVRAEAIAERILSRLRSPILLEGKSIRAVGSIGIAALAAGEGTAHLLRNADAAMYAAKSLGRNRVRIFDQSILDGAVRQMEIETELRHSVQDGSISVAYQPVYSLQRGSLEGFEALARWVHPKFGVISPEEFIPIAEETGLISSLGQQVLSQACRQVAAWNRRFKSSLKVSVNVSGWQLAGKGFLECVKDVLTDSRLEPELLKFEVTESVLLNDRETAAKMLTAARAMGIAIYLDDFGKGYSALHYLLEFPFDVIKIDKSFIKNVERDERHATVMRTIVQLAKKLEKSVVAEGIETQPQLEFVQRIGCEYAQGYLFSKALPAAEMIERLESEMEGLEEPLFCLPPLAADLRANLEESFS